MIGKAVAMMALAAGLLLGGHGYVQADTDPRFYALPGVGVGPFWVGEPIELAAFELWKLTGFAHDEQQRPAVYVDADGNLCASAPEWCISDNDGTRVTPGRLAWVWTRDSRVALVVAPTPVGPWASGRLDYYLRPMGYEMRTATSTGARWAARRRLPERRSRGGARGTGQGRRGRDPPDRGLDHDMGPKGEA